MDVYQLRSDFCDASLDAVSYSNVESSSAFPSHLGLLNSHDVVELIDLRQLNQTLNIRLGNIGTIAICLTEG